MARPLRAIRSRGAPRRAFSDKSSAEFKPFKGYRLDELPENTIETSKDETMQFFRDMALYRRFEITADQLYKQRLIRGL